MQINRVGVALIALFGLGGVAFARFGPTRLLGIIWVAVSVGMLVFAIHQRRKAGHQEWVFRNGLRGRATLVSASTGAVVNEMPVMKIVLDLEVPGQEPRRAGHRVVMPVFAARRMKPGLVLPVHVNPSDPGDFVLVW